MSGLNLLAMVFDALRPKPSGAPALGITGPDFGTLPTVILAGVLTSWAIAAALAVVFSAARRPSPPAAMTSPAVWFLGLAGVLFTPYIIFPLPTLVTAPLTMLSVAPTTLLGFFLVTRLQRFCRMPWWLSSLALLWGVLVSTGFGGAMNVWWISAGNAYLTGSAVPDLVDLSGLTQRGLVGISLSAGLFEETAKGLGVVVIFLAKPIAITISRSRLERSWRASPNPAPIAAVKARCEAIRPSV